MGIGRVQVSERMEQNAENQQIYDQQQTQRSYAPVGYKRNVVSSDDKEKYQYDSCMHRIIRDFRESEKFHSRLHLSNLFYYQMSSLSFFVRYSYQLSKYKNNKILLNIQKKQVKIFVLFSIIMVFLQGEIRFKQFNDQDILHKFTAIVNNSATKGVFFVKNSFLAKPITF